MQTQGIFIGEKALADAGALFVTSMTPGQTVLQNGVSATYSATHAMLAFQNTAALQSGIRCHVRDISFWPTVAPASGTCLLYAVAVDSGSRLPTTVAAVGSPATGTCYLATSQCTNIDKAATPVGQWYFPISTAGGVPPIIPAATSGARVLEGNGLLRSQIPIASSAGVSDSYRIHFGDDDIAGGQLVTAAANAACRVVETHPAVSIGPQEWFLFHLWSLSNATTGIAFGGLTTSHLEWQSGQ